MSSRLLLDQIKSTRNLLSIGRNKNYSQLNKLSSNIIGNGSGTNTPVRYKSYSNPVGNPGCGAGKGGGAGGSVRESGGGLGQFGAAQEEQFFFNKQREQLKALKKKMLERKDPALKKEK